MLLPLFLNYWLTRFNSCGYYRNFNAIVELAIPKAIPTKEAKADIETHPVIVEIGIS